MATPPDDDSQDRTLYHYCPTDAFRSIITSRKVWLSSLSQGNDSLEGKIVKETMLNLATNEGMNQKAKDQILIHFNNMENAFDALGFCLSEERDLLSQWRGYADDGRGVSIGFSERYLNKLKNWHNSIEKNNFRLLSVKYTKREHLKAVQESYKRIREKIMDEDKSDDEYIKSFMFDQPIRYTKSNRKNSELIVEILTLLDHFYALKSEAFKEEKEVRFISIYALQIDKTEWRAKPDRIVPFKSLELRDLEIPLIREVVLGPKHRTPRPIVEAMLRHAGFKDATVNRSSASYS